ncbi:MAG: PilT/PilU family type 4a pilus ATPase [Polyangiaceae bacterium]
MSGIDQLLSLVVGQGANELRLGVDQEPQMFASGQRKRLTLAKTSEFALRHLIADVIPKDFDDAIRTQGQLTLEHEVSGLARFQVTFLEHGPGTLRVLFQLIEAGKAVPRLDIGSREAASPPGKDTPTSLRPQAAEHENEVRRGASKEPTSPEEPVARPNLELIELLEIAFERGASDLHLSDGEPPHLRVDGLLRVIPALAELRITELFGLSPHTVSRLRDGYSVDLGLDAAPAQRIRVSLFRSSTGLSAAVRLLPKEAPDLASLGLPMPIEDLVDISHGLVLVCGATGSGKSTTLGALLRRALERRSILLTTLEDPIEFRLPTPAHSLVRRREIGRDVVDFPSGLRDALRGDPDVILVGELRDPETIQLALTAAETGHLVFGSLHSGGAASAIERVVDAYPTERRSQVRVQLADALRAVLAQKLLPRANGSGRVVALELLRVNHAAANVIREGRTSQIGTLLQSSKRDGMLSLDRCLADYVQAGLVTAQVARVAAQDPESLAMYLAR